VGVLWGALAAVEGGMAWGSVAFSYRSVMGARGEYGLGDGIATLAVGVLQLLAGWALLADGRNGRRIAAFLTVAALVASAVLVATGSPLAVATLAVSALVFYFLTRDGLGATFRRPADDSSEE
jgi:hypothetical protein